MGDTKKNNKIINRSGEMVMYSSAASIVLIAGILIILYLIFSGPDIAPSTGPVVTSPSTYGGGIILLDKFIGEVKAPTPPVKEHQLPGTTIYTSINTIELQRIDGLITKNSPFQKVPRTITFQADLSRSDNFMLSFNVKKAKGPLMIFLNGVLIFDAVITTESPKPITLPKEYLKQKNNITFIPESTGWQFWEANEYQLANIVVVADVTNYDNSRSTQTFVMTQDELTNMKAGLLTFIPDCNPTQNGVLIITLNNQQIYSGYPDCGLEMNLEVDKEKLLPGQNTISFYSDKGGYAIDSIKFTSVMEQYDTPAIYFNLPNDLFAAVSTFNARVVLRMIFSNNQPNNSPNQGEIIINGFRDQFSTSDSFFEATLDPNVLQPGANSISIIPLGDSLNINELIVELQDIS